MKYTAAQSATIRDIYRNTHITAVAGSGKSTAQAARVVKCLMVKDVVPANIIVLVYNDDAAVSLKEKIIALVREKLGDVEGLSEMFVGTLHAWCLRFLQDEVPYLRKFSILSDIQARLLVSRYSSGDYSGLKSVSYSSGKRKGQRLTASPGDIRTYLEVQNIVREERVPLVSLPRGLACLTNYKTLLTAKRYMDYSRVLVEALYELDDPQDPWGCQRRLAARLRFLFVDEYQDFNPIQEAILRRLHVMSGAVITVVGDDDQTLYGWRGSSVKNFQTFDERYPEVRRMVLGENFRSSLGIVAMAQAVGERIGEDDPRRQPKVMVAASHQPWQRGDMLALEWSTEEEQAQWIARKIQDSLGIPFQDSHEAEARGLSYADHAILLRSVRNDGLSIIAALKALKIPHYVAAMAQLLEPAEAAAIVISFDYLAARVTVQDVFAAWRSADLGITEDELAAGVRHLDTVRAWDDRFQGPCCLQHAFLGLLESMGVYEERIPPSPTGQARGEVVFYNLGRVSQAIGDFEAINYRLGTRRKFPLFASWLRDEAANGYEQSGENVARVRPDAVMILTIHKAKGRQWPVVFLPHLVQGVFPHAQNWPDRKWDLLPKSLLRDPEKYEPSMANERRLFYTAITRAQRFLFCSWAPSADRTHLRQASAFFHEFSADDHVLTREPASAPSAEKLPPRARQDTEHLTVTFTELKYYGLCPYQYKLRFHYGFRPPVAELLGFGKSIHDCSSEIHKRAMEGDSVDERQVSEIVGRHLHLPYASRQDRTRMRAVAVRVMEHYVRRFGQAISQVEMAEKPVEISGDGITVEGRVDYLRRLDTGERSIVEQKTAEDAEVYHSTRVQLLLGALGIQALTGRAPDLMETHQMQEGGSHSREVVDAGMLAEAEEMAFAAGRAIRDGRLPRLPMFCGTCAKCDHRGQCATWNERTAGDERRATM